MTPNTPDRWGLRPAVLLILTALVVGCACTVGSREVQVTSTVTWLDPEKGQLGTFGFRVSEFRGTYAPDDNSIGWGYDVGVERESIASIEIREGPGPLGGRLLYDLTTWGDPPWVPSGLAPQHYPGPLSIDEFYRIMASGNAHVEFTLQGDPRPVASGPLVVERSTAWNDSPCD